MVLKEKKVPLKELKSRMNRFRNRMDEFNPGWKMAVIFGKLNQYYFTGTMQSGVLFIPQNDEEVYWVRKSCERAYKETDFTNIKPMDSFRDAKASTGSFPDTVFIDTELVTLALLKRFQKHFTFNNIESVDNHILAVRAIKSDYELSLMRKAGKIHRRILEEIVPSILREGMSESDLAGELFPLMIKEGHQGVIRFNMFDTETVLGHVCFGESSLYPVYFNGPGGRYGMGPAVPLIGSRKRKLKKGDLVYVDIGCGVEGYHTDKTMVYMFGKPLEKEAYKLHEKCVSIEKEAALMLKPGEIPSNIYESIINKLSPEFLKNFMGWKKQQVPFIGHGIGLQVDELPVIAKNFNEPLKEGMVFALEPKKGIKNIGLVGTENTFIVTKEGGECITGINPDLILV